MTYCKYLMVLALCSVSSAQAQEASVEEIVNALAPDRQLTRSLRGVSVEPGKEVKVPSINIRVQFAFDSSELNTETMLSLENLGTALNSTKLQSFKFKIIGHTDAKGSDSYNQDLSERRALAVRNHLVSQYSIAADRLSSIGMGEAQLFDADDPEADINRRVEIRTVVAK